ncbi:hypothetical protein [Halodesulfurarchaeum sp.]|uniref:hypothetical protein n=1 Tax=Halodesulfurarchaeum sp. TaxID=1980530 RepID=UPI002FC2C749
MVTFMTTYYDYVLGFIPLVLVGFGAGLHAFGMPIEIAVAIGGLLALTLMGHALFVNAPVDRTTGSPESEQSDSTTVSFSD